MARSVGRGIRSPIRIGRGGAYQIAVRIERFQKAPLIEASVWFNSSQCLFVYVE